MHSTDLSVSVQQLRELRQVVQTQHHVCHGDCQWDRHARRVLQMLQDLQRPRRADVYHGRAGTHADELRGI